MNRAQVLAAATGRSMRPVALALVLGFSPVGHSASNPPPGSWVAGLDALYPSLESLYMDLHRNPELSLHEERTAATLAAKMRAIGFVVTEHVGGTGIVAVLKNGAGPTVLVRTDMDALPIKEATGLPYASTVTVKDAAGTLTPVMHACGHDVHMTSWVGAATLLAQSKDSWRGTLVFVGQPAEELVQGAAAMLEDGFLKRFPHPDDSIAIHDSALYASGTVSIVSGFALANVDMVDVTIYGRGGHGAAPHLAVDPIVIAARTIVALQTIVAREVNPLDPAVVTVGSIHGGTKHNIIPDEVKLQLTVRSYKQDVQKQLLAAIERIARAEALAAGAPKEPTVALAPKQSAVAVYNDPQLSERLAAALRRGLGDKSVVPGVPIMGSEDFGAFGTAARAPSVLIWIGAAEPGAFAKAQAAGTYVPNVHSALFAPDRVPTLRTGTAALTLAALELLGRP
ncbi:MAG TPA: amidohydrolase [Myxococcaceae bacterium]|nr:amidohydrolase [Myxococcaceae bacterium]